MKITEYLTDDDVLSKVDWHLYFRQREYLAGLIAGKKLNNELLDGILAFMEGMQDVADGLNYLPDELSKDGNTGLVSYPSLDGMRTK